LGFLLENRADAAVNPIRLNRWLNYSYLHIGHPDVFEHRELHARIPITLVLNTFSYNITEATLGLKLLRVRSVNYIDAAAYNNTSRRVKLRYEAVQQYESRTPHTAANPGIYTIRGNNIDIHPGPDSTAAGDIIVLEIVRQPALLSIDADVTLLPTAWDEMWYLGALWRAQRDLGYQELAEQTKQNFAALVNEVGGFPYIAVGDTRQSSGPGIETGNTGRYQ